MPHEAPARTSVSHRRGAAGVITFALLTTASVLFLSSLGHESSAERLASVINAVVLAFHSGLLAGVYMIAGVGFGRPVVALLRRLPGVRDVEPTVSQLWLQAPLGIALLLALSHAFGMGGLLSDGIGFWVSWAVLAVGILLVGDQVVRGPLRPERWVPMPTSLALAGPGLAVILTAACSPPGALWLGGASEGGAYDVLSYHLQLPKEWVAPGSNLWPVNHNVYSFLPSYMEAAYLHIGAMTRGGRADGGSFVAGSGIGVLASQMLHVWMGVLTALLIGRFVRVFSSERTGAFPGVIGGASAISVPWVMVVGSLAYNELGVTAMLAGALLVSLERSWSWAARGAAVGLLIGIACSIKPTALFMAAPFAGVFLLFMRPSRPVERLIATGAGSIAGLLALAPWLFRNWLASGNPVFPFASRLFGLSHWTQEQMDRYTRAHTFRGSVAERISLLFDDARGIMNEQWAVLFFFGVIAIVALVSLRRTRRTGILLALGFCSQLVAWLFLTHLQSRFLLPVVVPLAIALGLAATELISWVSGRTKTSSSQPHPLSHLAALVMALVPLSLAAWSWMIFASQRAGQPNQLLAVGGVEFLTGQAFSEEFANFQPGQRAQAIDQLPPAPRINFTLAADQAVYFIGSATPLYYIPVGGTASIVYHTTWDRNPLGDAMRASPDDYAAWTNAIRTMRRPGYESSVPSIDFVLVDLDELGRLYPTDPTKDIWFDPAVKPDLLPAWLQQECELVRAWRTGDTGGMFLFRFRGAGAPESRK